MLGWGTADFFAKKTVDVIGDLVPLLWSQFIGTVLLVAVAIVGGETISVSGLDCVELVAFGIVSGLSYLLLYHGFERGQVSLLSPIFAIYGGVVVLLSAGLFGEVIPPVRVAALLVILGGILVLVLDLGGVRRSLAERQLGGVPQVVGAMLIFAAWLVLWDRFVHDRSWVLPLAAVRAVATVTLVATARVQRVSVGVADRRLWPAVAAIAVGDVAAFGLVSLGFSATAHPSIVAVLSAAFSLPTLILARLFLGERLSRLQTVGVAVVLVGVALTGV
jgi:drug/metabolite transporter (DMT)-like permease